MATSDVNGQGAVRRVQAAIEQLIGFDPSQGLLGGPGGVRVVSEADLQMLSEQEALRWHEREAGRQVALAAGDGFDLSRVWYRVEVDGVLASEAGERADPPATRAGEAGFDESRRWYHGTASPRNFRSFKPGKHGVDELGRGIYFTSDPGVAEAWAGRAGQGGRIIPVLLRKGDVFDLAQPVDYLALARRLLERNVPTQKEREAARIRREKDVSDWTLEEQHLINDTHAELWRTWLLEGEQELAQYIRESRRSANWTLWLERAGYVGAVNRNSQIFGQIVVFNPRDIRSPWARFNPAKTGSADLLHSVADAAGPAVAPAGPRADDGYVFHVTPASNVQNIWRQGIEPRVGQLSAAAGEPLAASYHFADADALADGLMGWMADSFGEDEKLALFAVRKDMARLHPSAGAEFEWTSTREINPEALTLVSADIDSEPDILRTIDNVLSANDFADTAPVFYHGTSAVDFDHFEPSARGMFGAGVYLTSRRGSAMAYAEGSGEGEPRVIEAKVQLRNPLWVRASYESGEKYDLDSAAVPLIEALFGDRLGEAIAEIRDGDGMLGDEVVLAARAQGYDGLMLEWTDGVRDCVAFDGAQVSMAHGPREKQKSGAGFAPGFTEWFGGSQVVDAAGAPRVVYHGTSVWERDDRQLGDIQQFDRMASVNIVRRRASIDTVGSWFSTNPGRDGAEMYAGPGGAVYPVYLSISNPLVTTFDAMMARARQVSGLAKDAFVDGGAVEAFRSWLQAEGFDGLRIVHDQGRESESSEFQGQDAWIALEPAQIRFALGARATQLNVPSHEALQPRAGEEILASVASEGLLRMLREHRVAKARAVAAIGQVGDCAIVRSKRGDRWQMILRDASEPGKWRTQQFDARGFSGHMTFNTQQEAIESAASSGFSERDDEALDRLQDTPAFQRGLYATDILRLVNAGKISFSEGSSRMAAYDEEMAVLASVAGKVAQAFYIPSTDAIVMVADRIAPGDEKAVYLHEVMHKHGRRTVGQPSWDRLVGQVRAWERCAPETLERGIYDAASRRATHGAQGRDEWVAQEELLAYAVQEAVQRGVRPSLQAAEGTAAAWLADVSATLQGVIFQVVRGHPVALSPQDLVDLAYALAQLDNPVHGPAIRERLGDGGADVARRLADVVNGRTALAGFEKWSKGLPVVPLGQQRTWVSGKPLVVEALHGTMADFIRFDVNRSFVDGSMGAGIYASNDIHDVNVNYAGFGPDRIARIEEHKDALMHERWDSDGLDDDGIDGSDDGIHRMAERRAGVEHAGLVMPLFMRMENPCVFGGEGETRFECWSDEESGCARGPLVDLIAALNNDDHILRRGDIQEVLAELTEDALNDGGSVSVSDVLADITWRVESIDVGGGRGSVGELLRAPLYAVKPPRKPCSPPTKSSEQSLAHSFRTGVSLLRQSFRCRSGGAA